MDLRGYGAIRALNEIHNPAEGSVETVPLLGAKVIPMSEKTTFTNKDIGDEEYKGSDLSEIKKIDRRASVKKAEDLTNQELLAVILSGEKGASDAATALDTFDGHLIHTFCASLEELKNSGLKKLWTSFVWGRFHRTLFLHLFSSLFL